MKIELFKYNNVKENGDAGSGIANEVNVHCCVIHSDHSGGCDIPTCKCSPGQWMTFKSERTKDSKMEGVQLYFKDRAAMNRFIKSVIKAAKYPFLGGIMLWARFVFAQRITYLFNNE